MIASYKTPSAFDPHAAVPSAGPKSRMFPTLQITEDELVQPLT